MTKDQFNPYKENLKRYSNILTEDEIQSLIENINNPPAIGIRLNSLKGKTRERIKILADLYLWEFSSIPFSDHGWILKRKAHAPGMTIEHRMGQFYLQDPASMLPVSLFDFEKPHPLILDMAASPGGKTTHLIDCTGDRGFIIANDSSRNRISALRAVLSSWGGVNQIITQYPGELFGSWFPQTFDHVLLDAPCSMENFRPTSNHPMREISRAERIRLQERQIELLKSGLSALKIGGQLVYATCSLAPEEDEAVVDAVLSSQPDSFRVEEVSHKIQHLTPGLTHFDSKIFNPDLKNAVRIWPHQTGMSGFFSALITKLTPLQIDRLPPPERDFERTELTHLDNRTQVIVQEQIIDLFGFDLKDVLTTYQLEVFQRKEHLFLIPEQYLENFISLPYEYIGMPLGRWLKDALEPSHEFISRFGHLFSCGKLVLKQDLVPQWISGRDIRNPDFTQDFTGQYVMVTDGYGRNLGLGKVLANRLRNMLPR